MAVVLLLAIATVLAWKPGTPSIAEDSAWIGTVASGELAIEASGTGVLKPKEVRWLAAQTPASVQRVVHRAGAHVQAATVIIELASPEAVDALNAAEAAVLMARGELASRRADVQAQLLDHQVALATAEAGFEQAKVQLEVERRAFEHQVTPAVAYRRSQIESEQSERLVGFERRRVANYASNMRAQVAVAEANLERVQSEARHRGKQVQALSVVAGIPGVVQQVLVEEGQQVNAGVNLARVARPGALIAELRIPETLAKEIAIGQPARVDTRLGMVGGRVSRVDPAVEGGNVAVDVEFTSTLPTGVRPDLSVEGVIVISRLRDVLHIPKPAGAIANTNGNVFRLDRSGDRAERVPVVFGRASTRSIQVVSGLAPGDRVLLSDTSKFERHDVIRIN